MGRVENLDDFAFEIGCKMGNLPSMYSGLPLGAPLNSVTALDGVEGGSAKGWLCERDNTFPKGGELP